MNSFSINEFDWIGFDLDHCLIRYKLDKINELIFNGMISYLHEEKSQKYDDEILKLKYDVYYQCRGCIYDKLLGNIIKLSSKKKRVVKAYHGLSELSSDEIHELYNTNDGLKDFNGNRTERFHPLITQFDVPGGALLAVLVDYLDNKYGKTDSYVHVFQDLISGYQANFNEYGKGWYFPILSKVNVDMTVEIANYIYKRDEIKRWIEHVRKNLNTRIFILTNSRVDYTNLLLSYAFGNDWYESNLFDVVITYAKKGSFFHSSDTPFKNICLEKMFETNDIKPDELQLHNVYAHGNSADFHKFMAKVSDKPPEDLRVLYSGDHLLTDVYDSHTYTNWTSVAIIEELEHFIATTSSPEAQAKKQKTARLIEKIRHSNVWNSFFYVDDETNDEKSFWYEFIQQHCALAIPDVYTLTQYEPTKHRFKYAYGTNLCFQNGFKLK